MTQERRVCQEGFTRNFAGRYNVGTNETDYARFHDLRRDTLQGVALSAGEAEELAGCMAAIEAKESRLLLPTKERQQERIAELERRIVEMRQLVARRESLAARLRQVNQEVNAEREAIDAAFHRLIGAETNIAETATAGVR